VGLFRPMHGANHQLVKKHRSYTVEEVARLLRVHRGTVREWTRRGLPTCDDRRPILILGYQLADYLRTRRTQRKRPCSPGELYCVRCRTPRRPAGGMADYVAETANLGSLVGICPACSVLMYRRVNPARLHEIRGSLEIAVPKAR
jgi:hypothetical protein